MNNKPNDVLRVGAVGKYDEVLKPFMGMMEKELYANSGKGDRPGWLKMPADTCLLEIYYHLGKLQNAVKDGNGDGICEYAADVANLTMMLTDICGALNLFAAGHKVDQHASSENPILAYADSYRAMARQGVREVSIYAVITDLERNIAPLYREAEAVGLSLPSSGPMSFTWEHPTDKTRRVVSVSREEVAEHMSDELFDKLTASFCECESVGETNVVDCNCIDYTDEFKLLAEAPEVESNAACSIHREVQS